MKTQESSHRDPAAYLIVIGINDYAPNQYSKRTRLKNLVGCVNDAIGLRQVLQQRLQVPDHRVIMLTSPATVPGVADSRPATHHNIMAALEGICEQAAAGDQVWIHYSGHGTRLPTHHRDQKGDQGRDAALVPADVCTNRRFVRDVDLGRLLRRMVERDLVVTVTIDSCHGGGAFRAQQPKQVGETRYVHLPDEEQEAEERSGQQWWAAPGQVAPVAHRAGLLRDLDRGSGWFDDLPGLVLLAACNVLQGSKEICHRDGTWHGAFSHWLITALREADGAATALQLYRLVLAQVHGSLLDQTPQLEGELDRRLFAAEAAPFSHTITVLQTTPDGELLLHAGRSQLVTVGARLAIYPRLAVQLDDPRTRLAVAEVTSAAACRSVARIKSTVSDEPIRAGDQAVLIDPGTSELRTRVYLDLTAEHEATASGAINGVRTELAQWPSRFIDEVGDRDQADHLVVIRDGHYELCFPDGGMVPHVGPPLPVHRPDAAAELLRRLEHLARYQALAGLHNPVPDCPIAGCLQVELILGNRPVEASPSAPSAIGHPAPERVTVLVGQKPVLQLVNRSPVPLHLVVLDLRPDWSISQILPSRKGAAALVLEPGRSHHEPLTASLPDGLDRGTDLLKVIATTSPPSFRWTDLPPLAKPERRQTRSSDDPVNSLNNLLAALQLGTASACRSGNPDQPDHWTTTELTVEVVRPAAIPTG